MREYAKICLKGFCFTFSLWLHYVTRGYLFEGLQEIRGYRGKSWFKLNNLGFPLRMNMRLFS